MLAILYLLLAFLAGRAVKQLFRIDTQELFFRIAGRTDRLPPIWTFDFPFFLIAGVTVVTTVHYGLSYIFSFLLPDAVNPLLASNIALVPLLALLFFFAFRGEGAAILLRWRGYFSKKDGFYWKTLFFFLYFSVFLIFFSFFVNNGYLNSGATVFSDFAPHTTIIRSFSAGRNFPTQYPHFSGEGIQYHFLFFYLCGNLEFLGMRIDFAMNVPSILGILSFVLLLGCLGVLLTKRKGVFFLAPFMLFFRSSFAIFTYMKELIAKEGATLQSVLQDILFTNKFIGETLHDDWGLWSMNVYANQRHFLWGFSILLIVLFLFIPYVRKDVFCRRYLTSPAPWKIQNPRELCLAVLLILCLPYWHGSVLVALFCVLFVMAFFSENRLAFLAAALVGVGSALLQTRFFSGSASNVAKPAFLWGFLASDTSLPGVFSYLFQVLGISFLLMFILPLLQKDFRNRVLVFAFAAPTAFALCVSLTPDVTVNHKYVIIASALLNIFVADLFCLVCKIARDSGKSLRRGLYANFSKKRPPEPLPADSDAAEISRRKKRAVFFLPARFVQWIFSIVLTVSLAFSLFATGVPELFGYINKNLSTVKVDLHSPLIDWLENNTDPDDVFLTAPYHMNAFFFSGRRVFYGWPYYSWSAGYDAALREQTVRAMFEGCGGDLDAFMHYAKENKIRFVILDNALLDQTDYSVDVSFFESNFPAVVRFPNLQNMVIYQLY